MEMLQETGHRHTLGVTLSAISKKTAFMDTRLILQVGLDQLMDQPWQELKGNVRAIQISHFHSVKT